MRTSIILGATIIAKAINQEQVSEYAVFFTIVVVVMFVIDAIEFINKHT